MLLAFRNGRMLTDAGIESGRTLLVRDGRIEAHRRRERGHRAPIAPSISTAAC